jgi:hypothetical protein
VSSRKIKEEGILWLKTSKVFRQKVKKETVHYVDKIEETVSKTNFKASFLHNVKNTNMKLW